MGMNVGGVGLSSALSSAASGVSRGQQAMTEAATAAAQEPSVEAMTDMVVAQAQVKASAVVAREASETVGTLIDELA